MVKTTEIFDSNKDLVSIFLTMLLGQVFIEQIQQSIQLIHLTDVAIDLPNKTY